MFVATCFVIPQNRKTSFTDTVGFLIPQKFTSITSAKNELISNLTLGNKDNIIRVQELIQELLVQIGEDPKREGIIRTPERVAKAWAYFTKGYIQDLDSIINGAIFS